MHVQLLKISGLLKMGVVCISTCDFAGKVLEQYFFQVWKKRFILEFWESGECGSEGSEQLSLPEQEKQEQGGFAFWQEKNFEYMRQEQSRRSREDRSGRFAFLSRTLAIF